MTDERWLQVQDVFTRAIDCPLPDRPLFLEKACDGDDELRREVESLLECDSPDQQLVEIPPEWNIDAEPDMSGRRIGAYRLIRLIGHGGMSAVYLGVRDDDQYQKQVAVKLLKRGMDTDFLLSRFRQERQILANLEHPFISRLIDGGATEDGLPYLVMEYVDGVPITNYCADRNLSIEDRLRLFRLVCEAVQFAHQNLVVHRDVKPSNILTTREGVPKLLDFGIAKVLDQGLRTGATLTQRELRMLTPDYASPEQVQGLQVSTATDIYSLGAVLYQLLSNQRPHQFPTDSLLEIEKTICQTETEKPSAAAARNKDLSPGQRNQLRRQLSGDLDNIVLTAMRKEPQRRYASAAEFSEDLRRHMEGLPILAREDRWSYRAIKFIRRNRLAVGAAALLTASLIAGIVSTTFQARRAEHRFDLARQLAKAVVADIKGPMANLPGSTALRASMIQTVLRYLDGLAEDPGRDPEFEVEIADAYREVAGVEAHPFRSNLGQNGAALVHYQKAITIYERLASNPALKVHALSGLIGANIEAGDIETRSGDSSAAIARLQKVASIAADATARDSGAIAPGTWVYLYFRLGDAELRGGAPEQALVHYRKALDVCKQWVTTDSGLNARGSLNSAYYRLANALKQSGDLAEARENYVTLLRTDEEGLRQPDSVHDRSLAQNAHRALSSVLGNPDDLNLGDRAGAISHARAAVRIGEALAALDRQDVRAKGDLASTYRMLGNVLLEQQPAEALHAYKTATNLSGELSFAQRSNLNFRHSIASGQMGMGEALHRLGKNQESLPQLRPALEAMQSLAKQQSDQLSWTGDVAGVHRDIGHVLLATGDEKRALQNYQQALAITADLIRRAPASLNFQRQHADSLEALGRFYSTGAKRRPALKPEARQALEKSLAIWRDWNRRKVAVSYASTRESKVTGMIASISQL